MLRLVGGLLLVLLVPVVVLAWRDDGPSAGRTVVDKDPQVQTVRRPFNETAQVYKSLRGLTRPPETERDKFVEEITRAFGEIAADPRDPSREFRRWFHELAGGGAVWHESEITRRGLRELFTRAAERLEVTTGEITREQFLRYASDYLNADNSPRWSRRPPRTPASEARRAFDRLDTNQDELLDDTEMAAELQQVLLRWDHNGDRQIDPEEYEGYYHSRLRRAAREEGVELPGSEGEIEKPKVASDRPRVYRMGRLPDDLPRWFAEVDEDGDGQLGLYEWKQAGRGSADYLRLDLNSDGFVTVEEMLRVLRHAQKE